MQHFLLLYASPKQTRPLQLVEEFRLIQDNLERIDADIKLVNIGKVRKHDLNEKFSHYRPVLVHFSGHGSGDGEIVLEDENGKAIIVEQALLETVFRLHREAIKCVVLAC